MSVLLFAENSQGKIKKAVLEAASYGYAIADAAGDELVAVFLGETDEDLDEVLGKYGVTKVYHYDDEDLNAFNDQVFTAIVAEAAEEADATVIVMSQTYDGKALAPRVAARLDGSLVSGASTLPEKSGDGYTLQRPTNSGKGVETVQTHRDKTVISVKKNAFGLQVNEEDCEVEDASYEWRCDSGC